MAFLVGCGIPGPPQPPSLNLPVPVTELRAQRVGDSVELQWTDSSQNTDKTPVRTPGIASVCLETSLDGPCPVVQQVQALPGSTVTAALSLPGALRTGAVRPIYLRVSLENARRRSAGWSAPAMAVAGQAPANVTDVKAVNTADGVELHWQVTGSPAPAGSAESVYRIRRQRLTPPSQPTPQIKNDHEPDEQLLEVPDENGKVVSARDSSVARDTRYRYVVQATSRVNVGMQTLEMSGLPSAPVEVETASVFPPAPPKGLAVVPVWTDGAPGMDLNWEPNVEPTVVGYRVYRLTKLARRSLERRTLVSGSVPLTAPAFVDRGLEPGSTYEYLVVAVDSTGNVSGEAASDVVTALTTDK